MMRAVGLDVCRPADHITQFVDVMDVAQRHGLREQIADGGALDGAGQMCIRDRTSEMQKVLQILAEKPELGRLLAAM